MSVTTSFIPVAFHVSKLQLRVAERKGELTRILDVFGAHVVITCIENILVHESCARSDLAEKGDLDGFANFDSLALLNKDLTGKFAAVLAVQGRHPVLLRMMPLLERLERGHQIVSSGHTVRDDSFSDSSSRSTLNNGGDRVHGPDDLGLELRGHVELDLLEEILRCTEAANDENVLYHCQYLRSSCKSGQGLT